MPPGLVWRLAKCAYGLVDAALLWYKGVFELMWELGAVHSPADHELFVLACDGAVILAVPVHADDVLYGSTTEGLELFERKLGAACFVGPIGIGSLVFTGLDVAFSPATTTRSASVWGHQEAYIHGLDDIRTPADRLNAKGSAVSEGELTLYRRATGALLSVAGETLPHLKCGAAVLARHFQDALVANLIRANRQLAAARSVRALGLRIRPVAAAPFLYLFTDSSEVTVRSTAAQTGFFVFLGAAAGSFDPVGSATAAADMVRADVIAWGSHVQRGVTHSSYAAEAFSLLQGLQTALDAADVAALCFGGTAGAEKALQAFVDSRALNDSLSSSTATGSTEVRIAHAEVRDSHRFSTFSSVTWVPGSLQLAVDVTNPTGAGLLRAAVSSGWLPLPRSACATKSASGLLCTRP